MLAVNQQAQHDIAERNEEIDKLAGRIRELEQALLSTVETNRSITQLQQDLHRTKLREEELTQVLTHLLSFKRLLNLDLISCTSLFVKSYIRLKTVPSCLLDHYASVPLLG